MYYNFFFIHLGNKYDFHREYPSKENIILNEQFDCDICERIL